MTPKKNPEKRGRPTIADAPLKPTSVQFDLATLDRLDALCVKPFGRVSRAQIVRAAVAVGLPALEAQAKAAPNTKS